MNNFLDFISFKDPNVIYVVLGMVFINSASALIGTFAFLRKRALIGDAVAHSLLPGLCLGFLVAGEKNMLILLAGAFITGWLSTFAVDLIVNKTKVKQDAAIGIVLSTFFAIGIVLLTYIQHHASGQQAGLNNFLFGQAAAINKTDVWIFGIIMLIILSAILIFFKPFILVAFNHDYAQSLGLPVRSIEFLITSLTVLAIATGIQALGVILMSALIITPGATARLWTHRLPKMLLLAVIFSVFSGLGGAYVSYANSGTPTGPWVVLFLSIIIFASILLAPDKGLLSRMIRSRSNRLKIRNENILKAIFHLHENQNNQAFDLLLDIEQIINIRNFDTTGLVKGLNKLEHKGLITRQGNQFQLTAEGIKESKRVAKLHRLWEQYLLQRTQIDTDHVHSGAEAIEHILTPEMEAELEKELGIKGIPKEDY